MALPISPSPHSPKTPGRNMQDDGLKIPYYQQFVGFPLHLINIGISG
jgi:hypothetical protein